MLFLNGGFFALIVLVVVDLSVGTCTDSFRGRDALDNAPLIDGNNGLAYNIYQKRANFLSNFPFDTDLRNDSDWGTATCPTCHTDLARMVEGKIGGQFWVVNTQCVEGDQHLPELTLHQIDFIKRLITRYSNKLQLVTNAADIEPVWKSGKIASMIAIEGAQWMGSTAGMLRMYHDLGVRYITIARTCDRTWSHASPPGNKGQCVDCMINDFEKMNRLGIMVDLTHSTPKLAKDIMKLTRAPIIFSHSSAFSICNDDQNVPDDVLLSVKDNNGIVMVSFADVYVNCNKTRGATIEDVVDHINYIRNLIGVDHVGIGAHYDGTSTVPQGLEDVSKYPELFDRLHDNRENEPIWSAEDLEKLAGRNLIRVFLAVEDVRDCLSSESPWDDMRLINDTMRPADCRVANKWIDIMKRKASG